MGIDKPDIRNIIRYGVPENICSWAQELGRAGRDGLPANATIFYSMSNTDHAGAWVKGSLLNQDHCNRILKDFSLSWKYAMSHLVHKCRRIMLLELFGEGTSDLKQRMEGHVCCDVCQLEQTGSSDCSQHLKVLHDAINVIGEKGEVKLAQWIRGSTLAWTNAYNKACMSYGYSSENSEVWWRVFMRKCFILGLVNRQLKSIIKQNQHYAVQGVFTITSEGREHVENGMELIIPINMYNHPHHTNNQATKNAGKKVATKKGKGTRGLSVLKNLLQDKENWKTITTKSDYQFPGVFDSPLQPTLMYTPDCKSLAQSCQSNPHFIWDDIQLSKGTWRDRDIKLAIESEEKVDVVYRYAPCNGVKVCPEEGCGYVTSVSSRRPCSKHSEKKLVKSSSKSRCPVEFAYIYPKNFTTDNRRWICGFVHHQKEAVSNIHSHPIHGSSRMCSKVKECIANAAAINPGITPTELYKGVGMPFIPGAIDRGSSHLGRISRQVQKAKQLTPAGSTWNITEFEDLANEIDSQDTKNSGDTQEDINLHQLCRPYLVSTGMENEIQYIHTMNPLMSDLLARSMFVEADITYNENVEYKYLFNVAAFNETTLR